MQIMEIEYAYLDPCVELFMEVFNEDPWNQKWTEQNAKARLTEYFLSSRFIGFMLAEDDFLRAFVMGYLETWEDQTHFCIKEFCVQTDKWDSQVPHKLLESSKEELKQKGVSLLYSVVKENDNLKNAFKDNGFILSNSEQLYSSLV